MSSAAASTKAVTRWTVQTIPFVLAGCVAFATWAVVSPICIDYFVRDQRENGTAIVFLVLYFVFLTLTLITYLRTFLTIAFNPGVTPLGPQAAWTRAQGQRSPDSRRQSRRHQRRDDVESLPYSAGRDEHPDSPGLELFYTKDVFACETDGRPRWCSECCNWKPDRAHHCSEINRCVRKMDHFCPWVGGIISENSFKFFHQFLFWATCYCALCLAASGYCLHRQINDGRAVNGVLIAILALGGFFGLFTFMMTITSGRFIFLNMTNVDIIRHDMRVYQLAVRVSRDTPPSSHYGLITYPLPKQPSPRIPRGTANGHAPRPHDGPGEDSPRDLLATRTFAIVKTEMGENPWDLGLWRNWVSVMGTNPVDWLLPLNYSPCAKFESRESFYPMGPVYHGIREKYGLGWASDEKDGIELRELNGRRHRPPQNIQ